MKKIILSLSILSSYYAFSQNVGINTASPQVTLDVVGDAGNTAKLDGIIAPRVPVMS